MPRADSRQLTLEPFLEVTRERGMAASLDFDRSWRAALNKAIKECPKSRTEIAAAISLLIFGDTEDGEITKAQIDAWTGASRTDWRFPLVYLPAFIKVTGAHWLLDELAQRCGCKVLKGREALVARAVVVRSQLRRLKAEEAALEKVIGRRALDDEDEPR